MTSDEEKTEKFCLRFAGIHLQDVPYDRIRHHLIRVEHFPGIGNKFHANWGLANQEKKIRTTLNKNKMSKCKNLCTVIYTNKYNHSIYIHV